MNAHNIIHKLGGHLFISRAGASGFLSDKDSLLIMMPHGIRNGANKIMIHHEPSGTYTVDFKHTSLRTRTTSLVSSYPSVDGDQLKQIFSEELS